MGLTGLAGTVGRIGDQGDKAYSFLYRLNHGLFIKI